jgi:hypothetical protein
LRIANLASDEQLKNGEVMQNTVKQPGVGDDEGPTETLRDEEKSETGEIVPGAEGVPGVQKPDNEDIKDEKGLNTE